MSEDARHLSEEERQGLLEPIQDKFLEEAKKLGVFDVIIHNPFSLGGIPNDASHPDKLRAIEFMLDLINLSRNQGIAEDTIRTVVKLALESRKKMIIAGFNYEPIDINELDL